MPTSDSLVITLPQIQSAHVALHCEKARCLVNLVFRGHLLCQKNQHSRLPRSAHKWNCLSTILRTTGTSTQTFFCHRNECRCEQSVHLVKKLITSCRSSKASEKASYNSLAKPSQAARRAYTSTCAALLTYGAGMNANAKVPRSANAW